MENLALITILQNAIDGILTIDFIGNIESINPAACRLFGYEPEQLIGRKIETLLPCPDKQQCMDYRQRYLPKGSPSITGVKFEVTGLKKDGTSFPFEMRISAEECCGRKMYTCFIHDLSN